MQGLKIFALAAGCLIAGVSAQAAAPVSASGLIGDRVSDAQGKELGTLHDLAVDVDDGSVRYAIVERAETSRREREMRAVPLTALRPGLARDHLVVDAAAEAHEREAQPPPGAGTHVMRMKGIVGMTVDGPSGADYGIIEDLAVDLDTGRVLHAEVSLNAAARDARRELPFSALRFPPAQQRAILTSTGTPASSGPSARRGAAQGAGP
jgi:sporulation protein YlmC with PRC-barrel domain